MGSEMCIRDSHSEPRLRPTNGQTKALRMPISASAPGVPVPPDIFRLAIPSWASMLQTEKKLVNSHTTMRKGCTLLLQRKGVLEVDFNLLLSQLRHIGQVAEATLYAAPAREELIIPTGLSPEFGLDDFLRRAKHHQVRGVHGT